MKAFFLPQNRRFPSFVKLYLREAQEEISGSARRKFKKRREKKWEARFRKEPCGSE
ncbi:MAG: hypothetical protein SOY99_02085 [Alloprevotella sp.]|nr:hypothetical protein [Alloprevotella sp.]